MPLLIAFIAVPLIEIALFIQIGGAIGLWTTLAIVVITAVIGSTLVRSQGARELSKLRGSFQELRDPTEPLAHGAMILFSGALLLTPGFFTDFVGFALLFPPIRDAILRKVKSRVTMGGFQMGPQTDQAQRSQQSGPKDRVIDGEFEDITGKNTKSDRPSGWTKH